MNQANSQLAREIKLKAHEEVVYKNTKRYEEEGYTHHDAVNKAYCDCKSAWDQINQMASDGLLTEDILLDFWNSPFLYL